MPSPMLCTSWSYLMPRASMIQSCITLQSGRQEAKSYSRDYWKSLAVENLFLRLKQGANNTGFQKYCEDFSLNYHTPNVPGARPAHK